MENNKKNISDINIRDYEINILLDSYRNYCETDKPLANYMIKATIRYMSRLVFAIGWNKLFPFISNKECDYVYKQIFQLSDIEDKNTDTSHIEPRRFASILLQCAEAVGYKHKIDEEYELLNTLGNVRNINAHDIYKVNYNDFWNDAANAFSLFEGMFKGKDCSYIVPMGYSDNNNVSCFKFDVGNMYGSKIFLPVNDINYIQKSRTLFYCVTDKKTLEKIYYCLTPFIEAPRFVEGLLTHFRIYESVQNFGFGEPYDTLIYYTIYPKDLRHRKDKNTVEGDVEGDFEKTYIKFDRSSLYKDAIIDNKKIWTACLNGRTYINISSYPGYSDVLKNNLLYCKEICPITADIIDFCRNNAVQSTRIVGNGGLGKTTLILYVISLLINRTEYRNLYTNIIFFSAKKQYYNHNSKIPYSLSENEADINSYDQFIKKLAVLTGVVMSSDTKVAAKKIILKINEEESKKRFLLIIDDLDSLPTEDQIKINRFILNFQASKLKSIITTRDIEYNSASDYKLTELDEEKSLLYAKWFVDNKIDGIHSWDNWSEKVKASKMISKYGMGNPLIIQMLLVWIKTGDFEVNIAAEKTQNERISYMYSTVQNLMSDSEKNIFEIARRIYLNLNNDDKNKDMPVPLLKYLSFGLDIPEEEFNKSLKKLEQLKIFIVDDDYNLFRPFNLFIMSTTIVSDFKAKIPEMYVCFWNAIKNEPAKWFQSSKLFSNIIDCINSCENDYEFDNVIAKRILEKVYDSAPLTKNERTRVNEWLSSHSYKNREEKVHRLINEVERLTKELKEYGDSESCDVNIFDQHMVNIITLSEELSDSLKNNPDQNIEERFRNIKIRLKELY